MASIVTARRLRAAFFVFAAAVVAALFSLTVLLWPVTVQAQHLYIAEPLDCTHGPIRPLEEVRGRFPDARDLSPDEFATYLAAAGLTRGQHRMVDEGVWARLVAGNLGIAYVFPVYEGVLCGIWTMGEEAHSAGMSALGEALEDQGQPI